MPAFRPFLAVLPLAALAAFAAQAQDTTYRDFTSAQAYNVPEVPEVDNGTTSTPASYLATEGGNTGQAFGDATHGGTVFASALTGPDGGATGNSLLTFRVKLDGPGAPVNVPIEVIATGYTLATGTGTPTASSTANATASFAVSIGSFLLTASSNSTFNGEVTPALSFDQTITLQPGGFMDVSMQVIAESGSPSALGGYAEAFIDPVFIIDPAYAALYHLDGIPEPLASTVPEPGMAVLTLAGLAFMAAALRRARRQP